MAKSNQTKLWLENYNDSNAFASPDMVGDGFSNVGRNSSPAWGGQFQNGGKTRKRNPTEKEIKEWSDPGFRLNSVTDYFDPVTKKWAQSWFGDMTRNEQAIKNNLQPARLVQANLNTDSVTIQQPVRIPKYYDVVDTNNQTFGGGETFYKSTDLSDLNELPTEGWSRKTIPHYQMGGSIPGSVGFTYARTKGIPSEGKYAKKTLPSAQNGKEMQYYQNGLDFQPKTISKNGSWLDKAQTGYQTGDKVIYGTPEYEEAYNKGEVVTEDGQRSPIALDEVVIQNNYKRPRGFWEQSRDKFLKDNKDAGLFEAIGSVATYPLSVGQHALTYAIEDKVQDPSEAWGYNTKEGWLDSPGAFGRNFVDFSLNAGLDPANALGAGILTKENVLSKLGKIPTSIASKLRQGLQTNGFLNNILPSENYVKGIKKLMPETARFKTHTKDELKKLKLALSPDMTKALGRLDDNISEQMLQKYKWGEYATPKDFRLNVKKAILESERLKKINPKADFSKDIFKNKEIVEPNNDWLLSKPEYLSSFLDAKEIAKKTIRNKKQVKNFLEKSYINKMDLINQDPILKNIAEESPQYTDLIYDHLKNPTKSTDEFVNDLVKQSNTFTRSMHKSMNAGQISKEDFFTPQGSSMGFSDKNTIDVEGFPTSDMRGEYGKNKYKIFPNAERMADIANTPLEERWGKRFPNTFSGNENIDFGIGMHGSVENDFLHNAEVQRRLRNRTSVKSAGIIFPKVTKSDIMPYKYLYQPKHVVFNTPGQGELVKGFDVEQVSDVWNPFKPSGKFGKEPGYTHGFKDGGIIKDDRGQWDHPGEITEIGSNQITMQGVPYPVLGISDTGDTQMMYPEKDYKFKGKKVTEFPMAKNGLRQEQKGLVNLDDLTNFTNYNKPTKGWLNKYN